MKIDIQFRSSDFERNPQLISNCLSAPPEFRSSDFERNPQQVGGDMYSVT